MVICAGVLIEDHQRIHRAEWSLKLWWERRQERPVQTMIPLYPPLIHPRPVGYFGGAWMLAALKV